MKVNSIESHSKHSRRRIGKVILLTVSGLVVVGAGAGTGINIWITERYKQYMYSDIAHIPGRTVAIVPGARVYSDGTPTHSLEDRLLTALELYRAKKVKKILVSGDHGAPEYDEVNVMWRWLIENEVPSDDIFLDHAGFRTLDTMHRARYVFGVGDAIICTQKFHQVRSIFLARRVGIDAIGLIADRRVYRSAMKNSLREFLARVVAFTDTYVFDTQPRFLGQVIPIDKNAEQTHDQWTLPLKSMY